MDKEKKLNEILSELFEIEISEEMKDMSLFAAPFNINARNFLLLFLEVEKQFDITFPNQTIEEMKLVTYNGMILEIEKALSNC